MKANCLVQGVYRLLRAFLSWIMRSINCLLLITCLSFLFSPTLAQNCGTDHLASTILGQSPDLQQRKAKFDSLMMEKVYLRPDPGLRGSSLYTIPVVFHVIHNNGPENVSDSLIHASIDNLNDALAHRNYFDSILGVDTQIQVCLATQDENGDSTTGITRHISTHTSLDYDNFGDSIYRIEKWDGTQYLNIYVMASICNVYPFGGCYGGLGWYPYNHGNLEDGIFVVGGAVSYTQSTTLAHEVGHYLGLYHTFSSQCPTGDCRTTGDRVCDTPPDIRTNWLGCDTMQNSCQTDTLDTGPWNPYRPISLGGLGDQPDKERNFMDYSGCTYEFTQGQKDRMIAALTNERGSLLSSMGCFPGCAAPVVPDFALSDTSIIAGDSIVFTNASIGASQYQWFINGVPYSVAQDTQRHFNTQGTYQITLCGENQDVSCDECVTYEVTVDCPILTDFAVSDTVLTSEDTLILTNQSTGASSYEWWVNGNMVSTSTDTMLNFPGAGITAVTLVATNGICRDSSTIVYDVKCTPRATFQLQGDSYAPPEGGLLVDNTSASNASYEWFLGDQSLGFGNDTLLTTNTAFAGNLWLRSFNGYCYDSSEYQPYVQIADCDFREANDWFTGSVNHIDFDSLPVQGVFAGISTSWHNNTSASDVKGNLQFLITNQKVYNRDRQQMANDTGLVGFGSWYPSMISTRLPGSSHRYLIFNSTTTGIYNSEIDMLGDEGRGEMVRRNELLWSSTALPIELVHHANGHDMWLVGQYNDYPNYFIAAWLVSDTGVAANPVLSPLAISEVMHGNGDFRASPDGKMLANGIYNGSLGIRLYNFDNATGMGGYKGTLATDPHGPFSLSFSPGSTKLYYCNQNDQELWQYDLLADTPTEISSTLTLVGTTTGYHMAGIQAASDGKVYVGRWNGGLGAIQKPDEAGLDCQYTTNGITLYNGVSGWNLPRFPASYFRSSEANVWGEDSLCGASLNVPFQVCNLYGNDSVWWEGLGAATLIADSGATGRFDFGTNGYAAVVSHKQTVCGVFSDTMEVHLQAVIGANLGSDTLVCNSDSLLLTAPAGMSSYTWQDGSTQDSFWVTTAGAYSVELVDGIGCETSDTIEVLGLVGGPPVVQLPSDSLVCPAFSMLLNVGTIEGSIQWQNGDTTSTFMVNGPGLYWVEATDICGRTDRDSVNFQLLARPSVELGADTSLCPGETLLLDAGAGFSSYNWSGGAFTQTITITAAGTYLVTVTDVCNRDAIDSVQVGFLAVPVVNLGNDSTLCPGTSLVLDAGAGFASYAWSTGAQTQQINVTQGGLYTVTVTDLCNNTDMDDRVILFEAPFSLNLGPDTVVCPSQSLLLDAGAGFATYLWQDGSTNQTFLSTAPGTHWVLTATAANCSYLDSIEVDFCVGLEDELASEMRLFPNPTSGEFRAELHWTGVETIAQWRVIDVLGREVLNGQIEANGNGLFTVPMSLSVAGSYWMEFDVAGQRVGKRLVVE